MLYMSIGIDIFPKKQTDSLFVPLVCYCPTKYISAEPYSLIE